MCKNNKDCLKFRNIKDFENARKYGEVFVIMDALKLTLRFRYASSGTGELHLVAFPIDWLVHLSPIYQSRCKIYS